MLDQKERCSESTSESHAQTVDCRKGWSFRWSSSISIVDHAIVSLLVYTLVFTFASFVKFFYL